MENVCQHVKNMYNCSTIKCINIYQFVNGVCCILRHFFMSIEYIMNVDNQVTVIEITADLLYLIVLGDLTSIEKFINDIKKNNPSDTTEYMPVKIDNPSANKCHDIMSDINDNMMSKTVIIDDGVESAQCYTYAEGYNNQLYMIMTLNKIDEQEKYLLSYPKFELVDDGDPDEIVENWFKKKVKKIPKGIKKNMKLITVVGTNANILVIATKLSNKTKK